MQLIFQFLSSVSHTRSSVSAYVKAAVRVVLVVKKNNQTAIMNRETAKTMIAVSGKVVAAERSTIGLTDRSMTR